MKRYIQPRLQQQLTTLSTPVEGLRQFAACMLDLGLVYDDVRTMIVRNPATLLGLGPV